MDLGVDHGVAASPPAFGAERSPTRAPDSDSDSEDLGPETAVDVDDAEPARPVSPPRVDMQKPELEQTQIDGALLDNVGESGEDSEDEWNYYKGEGDQEEQNPAEEPDEPPLSETPCQDTSAWESSSVDMNSSPLNPDAPVFVPGTAGDVLLAESPRKPLPMDDVEVPDADKFKTEAIVRPAELLDLENCDQLNGHHNVSVHSTNTELLNGSKCEMDSLGLSFNVKSEKDKDGTLIETFERIQKDTTDFCNLQVFQTQNDTNPFTDNEDILKRLKNKESDPMSMSFYQEKDDDTCERAVSKDPLEILNSVQPLPDSDEDDDMQYNGISNRNGDDKENISPEHPTSDVHNSFTETARLEPDNNLFNKMTDNFANDNDFIKENPNIENEVERSTTYDSVLEFTSNTSLHETVAPTDTPESHKLLFEQIPEIPDGKTSEIEFVNVEETIQNKEIRPLTLTNDKFEQDFTTNHNETETLRNGTTPEHVTGISEAQIEYTETEFDSNIDPLLVQSKVTDKNESFDGSVAPPNVEGYVQESEKLIEDTLENKFNEQHDIDISYLEGIDKECTESTNPSAVLTNVNRSQLEPDSTISIDTYQQQLEPQEDIFQTKAATITETSSYESKENMLFNFDSTQQQESPIITSTCVTSMAKEVKYPDELLTIESGNDDQHAEIDIFSESHLVTSTVKDQIVDDLLSTSLDSHLLNESDSKTNLTSQFEELSINVLENQTEAKNPEAVAESSEAPDLLPEVTNAHLVTDVDIGVPESRAQEICVPVTSELQHEVAIASEIELKSNDLVRPPSLEIPAVTETQLAAGAAAAVAATAAVTAVAKTASKTAKTPTTASKATKASTTPRTPASASKKTTTPVPKTPTANLGKAAPAKTPTSASKPSTPKTPTTKTMPVKETVKVAAVSKTTAAKPAQTVAAKSPSATSKTSSVASKSATLTKTTTVSKSTTATSKPPSAASKTTAASKPATTKTQSSVDKLAPTKTSAPTKPVASRSVPTAAKPATARPAPPRTAPVPRVPLSARPAAKVTETDKKPLTNGDVKTLPKKTAAPRVAPPRAAPRPATAPAVKSATSRAPLEKTSKELANKKAITKAPTKAKSATATSAPKKIDPTKSTESAALRGGVAAKRSPSPPQPAADAALPDVIA